MTDKADIDPCATEASAPPCAPHAGGAAEAGLGETIFQHKRRSDWLAWPECGLLDVYRPAPPATFDPDRSDRR